MKKLIFTREELEEAILHSLEENIKEIILNNGVIYKNNFQEISMHIVDDIIFGFDDEQDVDFVIDDEEEDDDDDFEDEFDEDYGDDDAF